MPIGYFFLLCCSLCVLLKMSVRLHEAGPRFSLWILCCLVLATNGLVGRPTTIRWSDDVIHCPNKGLVVLEKIFYMQPLPEVCDSQCRMGPEATIDSCFFHFNSCVQRASENDVTAVYDSCNSATIPTSCNLTNTGLRASVLAGYSCIERNILHDPFNSTFGWKAYQFAFAFNQTTPSPIPSITHCDVFTQTRQPAFKITTLKPSSVKRPDTSDQPVSGNDITVVVDDVRKSVEESPFPKWWIVNASQFSVRFTVGAGGREYQRPFWILLEDDHNSFEVKCRHMDFPTSSSTTARDLPEVLSTEMPSDHQTGEFTLRDLVVAVVVACIVVAAIALLVCLVMRRRRRREEPDIYSTLSPLVLFDNTGSDGVATVLGPQQNGRERRGPCPPPPDSCHPEYQPSNRLPPGSALSNDSYGHCLDRGDNCHFRPPCSADDNAYLTPVAQRRDREQSMAGAETEAKRRAQENTEYDEIPALPSQRT